MLLLESCLSPGPASSLVTIRFTLVASRTVSYFLKLCMDPASATSLQVVPHSDYSEEGGRVCEYANEIKVGKKVRRHAWLDNSHKDS